MLGGLQPTRQPFRITRTLLFYLQKTEFIYIHAKLRLTKERENWQNILRKKSWRESQTLEAWDFENKFVNKIKAGFTNIKEKEYIFLKN